MYFVPGGYDSMVRALAHIPNYLRLILSKACTWGCRFGPWPYCNMCGCQPIQSVSLILMCLSLPYSSTFSKIQWKKYPQARINDKEKIRPQLFHKAKQWVTDTSKFMNWKPVNFIPTIMWDQHFPGTGGHSSVSLKQKSGYSLISMSKLVIKGKADHWGFGYSYIATIYETRGQLPEPLGHDCCKNPMDIPGGKVKEL